jgi:hypothetical protein
LATWILKIVCTDEESRRVRIISFLLKKVRICPYRYLQYKVKVITAVWCRNRQIDLREWDRKVLLLYGNVVCGSCHIINSKKRMKCPLNGSETVGFLYRKVKLKTK